MPELSLTNVPGTPVLVGVGGSQAYGLAHADSDTDYRGCFVAPSRAFFGMTRPTETYDRHEPNDIALHEIGKMLRLAAAANPTVLEVFFYRDYPIRTEVGDLLIENRDLFITSRIRETHVGYAYSQFKRLENRQGSFSAETAKRTEKHARHLLRLIQQAERALTTGVFDITVRDREEIFAFGQMDYSEMVVRAESEIERVKHVDSVLPDEPDMDAINDLLVSIREDFYYHETLPNTPV